MDGYLRRARSAFYADEAAAKPLHPVDAFEHARERRPEAGRVWLARLASVSEDEVRDVVRRVPRPVITEPSLEFALRANRRRLLALAHTSS